MCWLRRSFQNGTKAKGENLTFLNVSAKIYHFPAYGGYKHISDLFLGSVNEISKTKKYQQILLTGSRQT